jgi:type I restriction enzyme, S subunit
MSQIKDFVLGFYDGPHATPKEIDEGPIFLGIKNVTPEGRLDFSTIRHVSEDEYPRWTRRVLPQKDDVVFTYEATLHRYALIPEGFRGCLGRRMALIRPDKNKVHPRFLHYYMLSPMWRAEFEASIIVGVTVERVPLTKVPNFKVSFPEILVQKKIANILSAYDDLIENNRRRIALLEEAAQQLYKEWFVRFRFPGHEHVKIIDGVPAGWCRKTLGEVAATNETSHKAKELPPTINYVDISSVVQREITHKTSMLAEEAPGRARRIAKHGDVIWSNVRPNLKAYALVSEPEENDVFSTGFTVLTAKLVPYHYLYQFVTTQDFVSHLINFATGTSYPAVRPPDFELAYLLIPTDELLNQFQDFCGPNFDLISGLHKQNGVLAQARDILLPKLMNGEIVV